FLIGMAGSFPTQWLIHDGQNTWLLLAAFCLFIFGWFSKKDIAAGIGLACMLIKPQYFLLLALPALACRRRRLLLSTVAVAALILAASIAAFGPQTISSYPSMLNSIERSNQGVLPTWMICLRGPLSIVLPADIAFTLSSIVYAMTLG